MPNKAADVAQLSITFSNFTPSAEPDLPENSALAIGRFLARFPDYVELKLREEFLPKHLKPKPDQETFDSVDLLTGYPATVKELKRELGVSILNEARIWNTPQHLEFALRANQSPLNYILQSDTNTGKTIALLEAVSPYVERARAHRCSGGPTVGSPAKGAGKVFFIVPQRILVDKVYNDALNVYSDAAEYCTKIDGDVPPKKREPRYRSNDLIITTADALLSDLKASRVSLSECGCVVFDETHKLLKVKETKLDPSRHAYARLLTLINQQPESERPKILAASATPGKTELQLIELMKKIDKCMFHMMRFPDQFKSERVVAVDLEPKKIDCLQFLDQALKPVLARLYQIFLAELASRQKTGDFVKDTQQEVERNRIVAAIGIVKGLYRAVSGEFRLPSTPAFDKVSEILELLPKVTNGNSAQGEARRLIVALEEFGRFGRRLCNFGNYAALEYAGKRLAQVRFGGTTTGTKEGRLPRYLHTVYGRHVGPDKSPMPYYTAQAYAQLARATPYMAILQAKNWAELAERVLPTDHPKRSQIIEAVRSASSDKEQLLANEQASQAVFKVAREFMVQSADAFGRKEEILFDLIKQYRLQNGTGKVFVFVDDANIARYLAQKINLKFGDLGSQAIELVGASHNSRGERVVTIQQILSGQVREVVTTSAGEEGIHIGAADIGVHFTITAQPIRIIQRNGRMDQSANIYNLIYKGTPEERTYKRGAVDLARMRKAYQRFSAKVSRASRFGVEDWGDFIKKLER